MMMKKLNALFVAAALLALPGLSTAHPEHDDEPPKPPVAALKAELRTTKTGATVLVTKDGQAVSTARANGTLTLRDADRKTELVLKPAGRNAMKANSRKAISKGTAAQVVINLADKTMLSSELVAK